MSSPKNPDNPEEPQQIPPQPFFPRPKITIPVAPTHNTGGGGYIPSSPQKETPAEKIVLHWISGGELIERWGINAGTLADLIFEHGLKARDVRRGKGVNPNPCRNAWTAGPGAFMTRREWEYIFTLPAEKQKEEVSRIVKFDPDEVEAFEKAHPELLDMRVKPTPFQSEALPRSNEKEPRTETSNPIPRVWPDPRKSTRINHWTLQDNTLRISTYTEDQLDGETEFKLTSKNEMSLQAKLLYLLLLQREVTLVDIGKACYADKREQFMKTNTKSTITSRIKTLVSDLRKKLEKNGINPDIITALGPDTKEDTTVSLNVLSINDLDAKHMGSAPERRLRPQGEDDQALGNCIGSFYDISKKGKKRY